MASAWGYSWGRSWGNAWGTLVVAVPTPQGRDYWDVTVIGVDKKPRKQDLGVMLLLLG